MTSTTKERILTPINSMKKSKPDKNWKKKII